MGHKEGRMSGSRFTQERLYCGRDGLPRARDIRPDGLDDGRLPAPVGALARRPGCVRDATATARHAQAIR